MKTRTTYEGKGFEVTICHDVPFGEGALFLVDHADSHIEFDNFADFLTYLKEADAVIRTVIERLTLQEAKKCAAPTRPKK